MVEWEIQRAAILFRVQGLFEKKYKLNGEFQISGCVDTWEKYPNQRWHTKWEIWSQIQGTTKQINRKRDRKSEQKYDIGIILV